MEYNLYADCIQFFQRKINLRIYKQVNITLMNKPKIILLLAILFISLAIGIYFIGFQEGLDNAGVGVIVGGYLKDDKGNFVKANNTNIIIKRLTDNGVVAETEPDVLIDQHGFPILDATGKVTYNPQKYLLDENGQMRKGSDGMPMYNPNYGNKGDNATVGSYLRNDKGNLVTAGNGRVTIKKLNSKGIVVKTDPDIQLDKFGFPILNASGKVTYNPEVYQLDANGQIARHSNGNPIYNPTYKFTRESSVKFDSDNIDVTYHASEKDLISQTGTGDLNNNDIYVLKPDIIKAHKADLLAYKNALTLQAAARSGVEPDPVKKAAAISEADLAVSTASKKLDADSAIIEQSNRDFLAYQSAISSGDNNAITAATNVVSSNPNYVKIARSNVQGDINYYDPASFRFGPSNYVPNYEDSVYLSRTTGQSTTGEILNPAYMLGGVCNYYKNQPRQLEAACQKLDKNTCASTSCCVLLGGSKCVSGTEQGPAVKSNFSDIYVRNRDFYYYQGKCYGNCPP